MTGTALELLSTRLCPWLRPALKSLEAARQAQRLGHAWLVCGPPGSGKLNLALVLAYRLLRGATAEPPSLAATDAVAAMRDRHAPADHHPDLHWLYPEEDKRTISVEQVRTIGEALTLKSHSGGAKVVIVEPADGMTVAAANALLKTLEEPSGDTYLLLLAEQPGTLPATIRSRCQRLTIVPPDRDALNEWLQAREPQAIADLKWLAHGAPLRIAAMIDAEESSVFSELSKTLCMVSEDKIDSQAVAESWLRLPQGLALDWLGRQLHAALRRRLAPNVSTVVTDHPSTGLHNAWAHLTVRDLFEQHERVERLRSLAGTGINTELALQALLLGFQARRGRS